MATVSVVRVSIPRQTAEIKVGTPPWRSNCSSGRSVHEACFAILEVDDREGVSLTSHELEPFHHCFAYDLGAALIGDCVIESSWHLPQFRNDTVIRRGFGLWAVHKGGGMRLGRTNVLTKNRRASPRMSSRAGKCGDIPTPSMRCTPAIACERLFVTTK